MSPPKGRKEWHLFLRFYSFILSFPDACGQGGSIVCKGCYYYYFNLRSKSC